VTSYATGTSDLAQWARIVNVLERSPWPTGAVLDVGAGHGKAGVLLYEYLNVKPERIDGVEPDDALRVMLLARSRYTTVYAQQAQQLEPSVWARYDTVLMADVIEHMPHAEAMALLGLIPGQVVLSTPLDPGLEEHQRLADEIPPLERHVSQWAPLSFVLTGRLHKRFIEGGQLVVHLCPLAHSRAHDPMRGT
jgi:2-polyprenyl-3-methyl-5-hydroxy-6-metoxy-1,4-benzoquinol methylase